MKKIALLTGHYFFSKRKAGFHFLAHEYLKMGYEVTFVTIRLSTLSFLSNNHLLHEKYIYKNILKPIKKKNLTSFVNATFLHPTVKKYFYDIDFGYFLQNRIKKYLSNMDYIIFESNESLLFFDELKDINKKAKFIYRVSDDIPSLSPTPTLVKVEENIIEKFDLISVPALTIYNRLNTYKTKQLNLDLHGIDKNIFDNENKNPYLKNKINFIFVGQAQFDMAFLKIAYKLFPNYLFHIIGPIEAEIVSENVIFYGHMPFEDTIKYIKFADVGLITRYANSDLVKTLTDSLKVLQYSYCKLPVIAPTIMKSKRKNWFSYELSEVSIKESIENALKFDKKVFDNSKIYDWSMLAKKIIRIDDE